MNLIDVIKIIVESIIKVLQPKPTPVPIPDPIPTLALQLLQLHNNHRLRLGLSQLNLHQALGNAAQKHSNWMLQHKSLNHFEADKGPGDRISAEGYKWNAYGENIASGYATPQAVFQGWLNSSGHKTNIENARYKDVGFGVAGKYWTTDFATNFGVPGIALPGGLKGE